MSLGTIKMVELGHNQVEANLPGGTMSNSHSSGDWPERRSEQRSLADKYYSVQFTAKGLSSFYQFKLWNISTNGLCILVKEDSEILSYLKINDVIEMTYYLTDGQGANEILQTQIKHITKNEDGRFQGHFLVGLSILDKT